MSLHSPHSSLLVVESDRNLAEILSEALTDYGYAVELVASLEQAVLALCRMSHANAVVIAARLWNLPAAHVLNARVVTCGIPVLVLAYDNEPVRCCAGTAIRWSRYDSDAIRQGIATSLGGKRVNHGAF